MEGGSKGLLKKLMGAGKSKGKDIKGEGGLSGGDKEKRERRRRGSSGNMGGVSQN